MKSLRSLAVCVVLVLGMTLVIMASVADTRVADAAMRGDRDAVRALLKQGVDVNVAQGDGMTALHWAAYRDDTELAQMLTLAGANVGAITRINGMTPLFLAAQNGNPKLVDVLLKAGADAKAVLATGATPLMFAARAGNGEAVRLLIDRGADPNAREKGRGETALMFAAANNRPDAIKALLDRGANPSIASTTVDIAAKNAAAGGRGQRAATPPATATPASAAAAQGQRRGAAPAAAATMDEARPPRIDTMGGLTALLFAARQGHIPAAMALVDSGANINEVSPGDKSSPLLIATINGHFDLAKALLDRGADPKLASTAGATPLYTTINVQWPARTDYPQPDPSQEKVSYIELMQEMIKKGADPNSQLKSALWFTSFNFDLSRVNAAGATAFWRAAQVNDVAAMRMLVKAGADPKLRTNDGISPLNVATGAGFHGNDEVTAPGGWMPGVRYLVDELHLNVNDADDKEGLTPLHNAAARGDNEMVMYLIAHGAKVGAVSKNGSTVVDVANGPRQRIQPFHETIALLEMLGAKNSHKCVSC